MKRLIWFLTTIGFIAPLGVLMVQQMQAEHILDDALQLIVPGFSVEMGFPGLPGIVTPWYVVISSLVFGLTAGTKRGRYTSWKMSRGILHLAFQVFYHNTRLRLGRFMGFLWLFGWLGIALTIWQVLWGSWTGLVLIVGYWGVIVCAYYLHDRYSKWNFLKYRLPGRIRWLGIGQELKDAGGRWAHSFRRRGYSRR